MNIKTLVWNIYLHKVHLRLKFCDLSSYCEGRKDEQSMKDGEAEDKFGEMSVNLARHNLEVTLKRTKEECFRVAKEIALENVEGFKKMDAFVCKQYADEPKKMAEWEKIMQKYEFLDEEDEDEE
jgi:hypothetical protein